MAKNASWDILECIVFDNQADTNMTIESIRTILVEDHEITRIGLRKALANMPEISVVAEVGNGRDAVSKALELRPNLILMDIGLPGIDGIEATRVIKEGMETKVILITSHDGQDDVFAGLSAGADAYCLKGISSSQLANAIRSVLDGAVWLDPGIAKQVLDHAVGNSSRKPATESKNGNDFGLSEREGQVLNLVVEGLSNQEIAERLFLSIDTVKSHLRRVMEKLRVSDRTQAAVKAIRLGLDYR